MCGQTIELEVSNTRNVLLRIICCIQRKAIPIKTFIAIEKNEKDGVVKVNIESNRVQCKLLIEELIQLEDVQQVKGNFDPLPSAELSDIYEE